MKEIKSVEELKEKYKDYIISDGENYECEVGEIIDQAVSITEAKMKKENEKLKKALAAYLNCDSYYTSCKNCATTINNCVRIEQKAQQELAELKAKQRKQREQSQHH